MHGSWLFPMECVPHLWKLLMPRRGTVSLSTLVPTRGSRSKEVNGRTGFPVSLWFDLVCRRVWFFVFCARSLACLFVCGGRKGRKERVLWGRGGEAEVCVQRFCKAGLVALFFKSPLPTICDSHHCSMPVLGKLTDLKLPFVHPAISHIILKS